MSINSYKNRKWRKLNYDSDYFYYSDDYEDDDDSDDSNDINFNNSRVVYRYVDEINKWVKYNDWDEWWQCNAIYEYNLKKEGIQNDRSYCEFYDNLNQILKQENSYSIEQIIQKYEQNELQELINQQNVQIVISKWIYQDSQHLLKLTNIFEKLSSLEKLAITFQYKVGVFQFLNFLFNIQFLNKNVEIILNVLTTIQHSYYQIVVDNSFNFKLDNLNNLQIVIKNGIFLDYNDLFMLGNIIQKLILLEKLTFNFHFENYTEGIFQFLLVVLNLKIQKQLKILVSINKYYCYPQLPPAVIKAIQQINHISEFEFYFKSNLAIYFINKHFSPQKRIQNLLVNTNCISFGNQGDLSDLKSLNVVSYGQSPNQYDLINICQNLQKFIPLKTLNLQILIQDKNIGQMLEQSLCKLNLENLSLKVQENMILIDQPNLQSLDLEIVIEKKQFDSKIIGDSFNILKNLKKLKLKYEYNKDIGSINNDIMIKCLQGIETLEYLDLKISKFENHQLEMLTNLKNLKSLKLFSSFHSNIFINCSKFKQLFCFECNFVSFSTKDERCIQKIMKQKRLVKINLNLCYY